MDRLTRKELKSDRFALEVRHGVEFVSVHRRQMILYGAIAAVVAICATGAYFYLQHQRQVRQEKLAAALQIQNAKSGPAENQFTLSFPTDAARDKATQKAFTEIAAQYPGTEEGTIAEYMLASLAADQGNTAEAERRFKETVDSGKGPYVSLGKLALAEIYQSEGKLPDAEKLVRSVIDKPTVLVSKEEATIELARILAPSKPQEARKILEPLRTERSAVSRVALTALSELPTK